MQSPTYNKKYTTSIPSLKDKSSQSDNIGQVLNLLLANKEYDLVPHTEYAENHPVNEKGLVKTFFFLSGASWVFNLFFLFVKY